MKNFHVKPTLAAILGVALLSAPFSASWATLILDFSFSNIGTSGQDIGDPVVGQILGLPTDGVDKKATSVLITSSPFEGSEGDYILGNNVQFNLFTTVGGTLTAIDFQADFEPVAAPGTTADRFRLSFLGDVNNANIGNNALLTTLGGGPVISGKTFPNAFSSTITNPVPSPAPLALMGAGAFALLVSRRRYSLPKL